MRTCSVRHRTDLRSPGCSHRSGSQITDIAMRRPSAAGARRAGRSGERGSHRWRAGRAPAVRVSVTGSAVCLR